MTRSAAKRAAELVHDSNLSYIECETLVANLLREDRERVRMERAIIAWWTLFYGSSNAKSFYSGPNKTLAAIAQRLTNRKETK